jgi:colicin import membrane protein
MTSILYQFTRMPMILVAGFVFSLPISASAAGEGKLSLPLLADVISTLNLTYSAGAIQSANMAEQAIVEANKTKIDLLKWYAQAEQACAEKFFVTSCLNDIKLVRRDKLSILQRITVEAKAWQRKQRIEQLDEKLQEKNEQK